MEGKIFRYWLHCVPGIGTRAIERLLEVFGTEQAVYEAKDTALQRALSARQLQAFTEFRKETDPERNYEILRKKGIAFYTKQDREYPERLRKLVPAPYGIYCLGRMPEEKVPAVAVIGARECSEYGSYMAKSFASALAGAGVAIVSGMARGIDGIGQQAAIQGGGKTYAVLGCGADICYPASNRLLYEEILEKEGGILSIYPPGTAPQKQLFPERNRIVAGLSDLLLVVEARQKSGTWITVDMALEQGKSVYAVPGRLTDRLSDGCNMLIRQGAGIALAPEDLLAELAILTHRGEILAGRTKAEEYDEASADDKEGDEDAVLKFLDLQPLTVDVIYSKMQAAGGEMGFSEIMTKLVNLCLEGKAEQVGSNYFVKKMP